MDALRVVTQLHDLSVNPKNRSAIVKDQGCLPGLVLFLDNENEEVVMKTLETLHLLALHGPNRKSMRTEMGMLTSLQSISTQTKLNEKCRAMAKTIRDSLISSQSQPKKRQDVNKPQFFLGAGNKRAKIITLKIEGMHNLSHRKLVEDQLLHVKGIISFTFDLSRNRCTIRARNDIQPQKVCEQINMTKAMTARQIVKNQEGEEVMLSFGKNPTSKAATDSKMPDYLPEDDDVAEEKAVIKVGGKNNNNNSGWFSGVSNFISGSLYW